MEVEDVHDLFDDGDDDRGGYGSDEAIEDNRYDGAAGSRKQIFLTSIYHVFGFVCIAVH